jgi:hypothetical protein
MTSAPKLELGSINNWRLAVIVTLAAHFLPSVYGFTFPPYSPVPANFDREKCGDWKQFTLIFIHMQKCGGTSVEVSLRQFAWMCGIGYMRYPGVKKSWAANLKSGKINIVTGHNFYGIHKHLPRNRQYAYVTVLREPVARLISHLHHTGPPKNCGSKCSLWKYGKITGNYYLRHLVTQSSPLDRRKNARKIANGLSDAMSNLHKVEVVGRLSELHKWFAAVQRLLRDRVRLDMELPPLGFLNVRNLNTVVTASMNDTSSIQVMESKSTRNGNDPASNRHYPESVLSRLRSMMKSDYLLWSTAQALAQALRHVNQQEQHF